jgi:hypothetical protein
MTSKADELLVELFLLRLRYSNGDIRRVANTRGLVDEPILKDLIDMLGNLRSALPVKKVSRGRSAAVRKKKASAPSDKKLDFGGSSQKADTEPFVSLAKTLMRK